MDFDTEEKIEDALVALLDSQVGSIRIFPAWGYSSATLQFPCVIVHTGDALPVADEAEWANAREFPVECALMVESADEIGGTAKIITTIREQNRAARSEIYNILAGSDLTQRLTDLGHEGIIFSHAQLESAPRSAENRKLITTFTVSVIATPIED